MRVEQNCATCMCAATARAAKSEMHRRSEEADLLAKVTPLLDGQAALAVDADLPALSGVVDGKLPRFLLIASMPPGESGAERQLQLEQILDRYRTAQITDVHYLDFDSVVGRLSAMHGMENKDQGTYEAWAFVENLFLYGQGKGMVEDAITRFAEQNSSGSLALNPGYQAAYSNAGRDERGESLLYAQLDGGAAGRRARPISRRSKQFLPMAGRVASRSVRNWRSARRWKPGENAPIRSN